MKTNRLKILAMGLLFWASLIAQAAPLDEARDREMRDRYETVLLRNPFQERAFNQVYEGYSKVEGVDKWIETLKPQVEGTNGLSALLLLGQIYDRQFKMTNAIAAFENAATKGENRPAFKVLLGTLYYKAGQDDKAAEFLGASLDSLTDLDQRASVCRMLGNLYLRQGKRDEAIAVWKRISEQNPDEIFSQLELAEIYEDNRMWTNAISVYRQIAGLSKEDPYRHCRALRSIGQCQVQDEKFKDAIATYEEALELVLPGNWLFEDLKLRLVGVYEDIGDLAGLVKYINAKLEQNPGDEEFRDLLAETDIRMAKFDDAEKQYRLMLERNPRSGAIYEKLIALHTRSGKKTEVVSAFEKLIEMFPTDADYLRRLGEFHLRDNNLDKAKETWRRLIKDSPTTEKLAQLAGWFESYDFPDEAIEAYSKALEKGKNKDSLARLAALKFHKGDEQEAVKLWLSIIDPATSKVEDYAEVASILESNQKIDEAMKLRKAAVEKDGANLESRLAYAKILLRQEKFDDAAAEFEALAGQDKNEFMTQQGENGLLEAWRGAGVLAEKQKAWEKELEANPKNAKLLGQLARLYERGGQREKAIQLYEHRRQTEPDNIEYLRSLASLYKSGRQTEQAIEIFKSLLQKDKNRARVYQQELLDIYLSVDLKEEAIAAAQQVVSLAAGDPEARLTLAQVHQMYRQPEKALDEYRYALRLEPNEPDYWRQYGEALESEKRFGEAQEAFRKMLDVSKEDSTRIRSIGNLARIYLQQDQLDMLIGEFNRRIRNTPKKLAAYEELAAIYKESGQIFKSVEILESGLQAVDDKPEALKSLVRTAYEAQDFAKVRSYYEQLVAISGKPSAQEFEKLGQIYAQLGEIEKAKETWSKILEQAPKDAKAADKVASLLRNQGFTDEALLVKAKAVELEPGNYRRRYEYAQLLAQGDQPVEAMAQLNLILEIGDTEEAKKEQEKEKTVKKLTKGNPQNMNRAYQFMYGSRIYRSSYPNQGWQGTFKNFRPQLLQYMASLGQQSVGEEAFVEQFKNRVTKRPNDVDAKRDLLTVLEMYNQMDDALKLAEEILTAAPDDVELLQRTALLYSNEQKHDKAISLLEKLAKSQPKERLAAAQGLVPLYFKSKQEDKALELIRQIETENLNDVQILYVLGSLLQQNQKYDEAKKVFDKIAEIDPNQRDSVRNQMAALAKQSGKLDEAQKLYREILLAEPINQRGLFYTRQRVDIYSPDLNPNNLPRYQNPMQSLPQNALGYIDYWKTTAFSEVNQNDKSRTNGTSIVQEMEKAAREYKSSLPPSAKKRSWECARLLVAHYVVEKEFDKALDLLNALNQAGMDDVELYNASIYVAQQKEDYSAMIRSYENLQQRYPAKTRDIALAKTATLLIAKKYDDAAKAIRDLSQQRVPPATILNLIQSFVTAGERKLAGQLLEEHLASVSRSSQALGMLAQLHATDNEFDSAIALANEAWERKAHGRQAANYTYYGYQPYYSRYGQTDTLLRDLHRYYVAAGKSEELLAKFKEQLEKQPGSVQAHENLAELYRLGDQRDKALEIYEGLAAKRPHLLQIKRTIAQLYTDSGDFKKATDLYEQLIKANPALYQQLSWELRSIYQRSGKGKELATMEDKLMAKARDPNQLANLAYQMKDAGELDKAIDLWRKAAKLSPGQSYYQSQLASVLLEDGQLDEALKLFQEWLDSPSIRAQGWIDYNMLKQLAGLYRATGKLDELKTRCEADLKKNSGDMIAKALQTQIALLEKRFDDALAGFKASVETGRDPNVLNELIQFAGISGKVTEVLELGQNDSLKNAWDLQSLSRLYFANGDFKRGEETLLTWMEQQMQQGNGSWAIQEGVRQLGEFNRWDAAEKFVRKHRTDPMQQYEAEQIDREIAENYIKEDRYKSIVDEVLKKASFKGRDLDLMKMISQQYQSTGHPNLRQAFLEKLCAADPDNRELASQLAAQYNNTTEIEKKLALFKKLKTAEPNNAKYQEGYAAALIHAGQSGEALKDLTAWAAAKPLEARYSLLAKEQKLAGQFRQARVSMLKAIDLADPSKKTELNLALAEFDAEHGEPGKLKNALEENFQKRKDAATFRRFLTYLQKQGYADEAYHAVTNNSDKGFFDRYQGTDFLELCLNQSDYKTPMEMTWQFTRYGERWNRDYYFDQVAKLFQERGKLTMFVEDFGRRIDAESPRHRGMLEKLAQGYERAGLLESAVEIYDRLLALSRFNRTAVNAKARLLVKLNRGDDAIALLRDPKGLMNLNDELESKFALVSALVKLKRVDEAEKEITDVLAWAKGAALQERIGRLYFEQENFAKAAEFFEKSQKFQRGGSFDQLRADLGKCYAKSGRETDALQTWNEMISDDRQNALNSAHDWLIAERNFALAEKLDRARIAANTNEPNFYRLLADTLQASGKTDEAFETYEAAGKSLKKAKADNLRASFAKFIQDNDLTERAIQLSEKNNSSFLVTTLVKVVGGSASKEQALRVAKCAAAQNLLPADQISLADALAKLKENAAAAEWYRKAIGASNLTQRVSAAKGLVNVGMPKEAVSVLGEMFKTKPQDFVTDTNLLIAIAKTADASLIGQIMQERANFSLNEAEENYYAVVLNYFGGKTPEARAQIPALVEATLSPAELSMVSFICAEQGMTAERDRILQRLASGGCGSAIFWQANSDLVKSYARQGEIKKAVQSFSKLLPIVRQSTEEGARAALAEAVTAENFPEFKAAVLEIARQKKNDDRVSHLLGLCEQVAQRVGIRQSAAQLAEELQLAGMERNETLAWDDLLEHWEISAPFPFDNAEAIFPPEREYLSKNPSASGNAAWKKTDPKQVLGIVCPDQILGISDDEKNRKVAYARAAIESAENRDVIFYFGSSTWAKVWVNGELVHTNQIKRGCVPDQDRFTARLSKGVNSVLVKTGNNADDGWNFCLRMSK